MTNNILDYKIDRASPICHIYIYIYIYVCVCVISIVEVTHKKYTAKLP